ncbi:MAG: hypothetical protein PHW60_15715, partial [Kiritimatiellae bacterium]|nr:hypothetical protein [Kiritimatiellia bacterium]
MNKMKTWIVLGLLAITGATGWSGTLGLLDDGRSYITDGMLKTIHEAGWQTVMLKAKDLADESKTAALDVIFLPGGWNAYYFADFKGRRNLVKFVAGGKGILAGAFRSGYSRTANRPLFPEVGATYNRVNSPFVSARGDSELAKAIDQPFCPGSWDHLNVKVGPLGKVFAVNGEDAIGVYGEIYGGRYLVFGAFIGADATNAPMQGTARSVLLKSLDWLTSAPKLSDGEKTKLQSRADLDFLRREKTYDWTINERGPDRGPGILPQIRNQLAIALESRLYSLQYMCTYLSGKPLDDCRAAADELKKAVDTLDTNFRKESAEVTARIGRMTVDELTADNPVLNYSNVLQLIEATPGKTDEDKTSMKRAAQRGEYAPKQTALFLNGDAIREKLLPEQELKALAGRADKTIAQLRPIVKQAKASQAAQEHKR